MYVSMYVCMYVSIGGCGGVSLSLARPHCDRKLFGVVRERTRWKARWKGGQNLMLLVSPFPFPLGAFHSSLGEHGDPSLHISSIVF
jgi:hypothetical protein